MENIPENNDSLPIRDPALLSMYDLVEDMTTLAEDEINPSFASIAHETERYERLEEIASGGMKHIYRAYDKFTHRYVAMAMLAPDAPTDRFDPFIHEAWITAQLDHPNIIQIHDLAMTPDHRPFFTMDLKSGHSLRQLIEQRRETSSPIRSEEFQPLELFIKIGEAIAYAHSKGILHLDLKPGNIQIGRYGGVVVCDWGLAKIVNACETTNRNMEAWDLDIDLKTTETLHGQIKGTPGYMAPEQIESDGEKTQQTDIYELGCILYFLLTQTDPLKGTHKEIMNQTLSGFLTAKQLSQTPQIPKPLRSIIKKATALKPSERYESVEQLIRDIRKYQNGYSPSAQQSGFIHETALFYHRNRKLCNLVLSTILLLTLSTAVFIQRIQQSRKNESEARMKAQQALRLYDDEKTSRQLQNKSIAKGKYLLGVQLSNQYFYSDPKAAVRQALVEQGRGLKMDPDNESLAMQKFYLHFLILDLKTALRFADQYHRDFPDEIIDLIEIARAVPQPVASASPPLSPEEFAVIIHTMTTSKQGRLRQPLMNKMLLYDRAVRNDFSNYDVVIREALLFFNRKWTGRFNYNAQSRHLTLQGESLKTLAHSWYDRQISLLSSLDIESLDISGTGVYSLTHLYGLPLKELDISNTLISNLSGIDQIPTLRQLTVSRNQFTAKQIDSLPDSVQVQYR